MNDNYQQWMILQEQSELFHSHIPSVWCDRRQQLLVFNYPLDRNASMSSASSTLSLTDHVSVVSGHSVHTVNTPTVSKCHR